VNIQADTPSLLYADEFLEDDPEYIVVIMHGTSLFLLYSGNDGTIETFARESW
jgi:hypothetical protein